MSGSALNLDDRRVRCQPLIGSGQGGAMSVMQRDETRADVLFCLQRGRALRWHVNITEAGMGRTVGEEEHKGGVRKMDPSTR